MIGEVSHDIEATDFWHPEIQKGQIERFLINQVAGFSTTVGFRNLVTPAAQQRSQCIQQAGFVVRYQYPCP
jgi:hypothetical protein